MNAPAERRMNVTEYLAWAIGQPRGRYELAGGRVVAMAPERVRHNLAKLAAARALQDAIARAGLPCEAYTDGMTVVIDEYTAREPDAAVQCGRAPDEDSLVLDQPVVVVEVVSPSSEDADTGTKLVEYFSVASIRHYLVIDPERRAVVHHLRLDGGEIRIRIVTAGDMHLAPPGLTLMAEELFPAKRET